MFSSPIGHSGAHWSKLPTTFGFSRTYNYNKIYTMSCDVRAITTLVGTVPRVLNLLWTWNYCCKLEIVCADGTTFVVTKGFDALREDH